MRYQRTETKPINDAVKILEAHIVPIYGEPGGTYFVVTLTTIYYGWMGREYESKSKVFSEDEYDAAEYYCDNFFEEEL